jgi:two-component system cell cycle sensor histidine kinase/response regulator CckA
MKSFLEQQGYTVFSAGSGMEALSLVDRCSLPIHVLVTDVVMPDIRGTDLSGRLLTCRPNVQVIYVSGYSDEEIKDSAVAFLQKPFRMQELGAKIRQMLGESDASAACAAAGDLSTEVDHARDPDCERCANDAVPQ